MSVGGSVADLSPDDPELRHLARPGSPGWTWRAPAAAGDGPGSTRMDPRQVVVPTADRGEWVAEEGETTVYLGSAFEVAVASVTSPSLRHRSVDVVRSRFEGVAAVAEDHEGRVLLLWRHRWVTNSWGFELPTGDVGVDEEPVQAAEREVRERTGWATVAGHGRLVWTAARAPEFSDNVGHLVWLQAASRVAQPDPDAAAHLSWLDPHQVLDALAHDRVNDLGTLAALWWWLSARGTAIQWSAGTVRRGSGG